MCLIVDANLVAAVFLQSPGDDFEPVQRALFTKRAKAVWGGDLRREYLKLKRFRRLFAELDRQGVLRGVRDDLVEQEKNKVVKEANCVSDDHHLIALARVSRTRLLCSRDRDLHADFTNPRILSPAGNVYQRKSHRHLIRKHCG